MANPAIDKILKLPNSQKIGILVFILVIIVGAYIWFLYVPDMEKLKTYKEELIKLQTQHSEQQKILADLPRYRLEVQQLQIELDKALKMLPNTREIPSLLTNISNLAQESGLEINLFQPKTEIAKDFYAEIPVEMNVYGKYHQLGMFFDKISKLPRIVNVLELNIRRKLQTGKTRENIIAIEASFNATTFKFLEKTGASDAGTKKKPDKSSKK
jgi:type IV pilus assembly protein PilO